MTEDALTLLKKERQQWRRNPLKGYEAHPRRNKNGTLNYMLWDCGVPGKKGTPWQGGIFWLEVTFTEEYPTKPPQCKFVPTVLHPNVYPSGIVKYPLLEEDWQPGITLKCLMTCIQELLYMPNMNDAVAMRAVYLMKWRPRDYNRIVRAQAHDMSPMMSSDEED
ncbi:hypothetical protein KR026_003267 [Drosophila bipectinata]|nr:SUMO-conjugating enzyme UBC9-B-like [Drosophila bipectinata]KAH8246397.1 hypothetical protein KR026_003267 [Drosophila bipectinata]